MSDERYLHQLFAWSSSRSSGLREFASTTKVVVPEGGEVSSLAFGLSSSVSSTRSPPGIHDKRPLHELVPLQTTLDPMIPGQDIQDCLRHLFLYLRSWRVGNNAETAAPIFEASEPILPTVERPIKVDEGLALIALALLYRSVNAGEEEEPVVTALGAFAAPSTIQPHVNTPDLLLFFQPLHASSLSRTLDVLDVRLGRERFLRGGAFR
ncbi:hypothetical protein BDM02DRAFT_3192239 [Thelephora ganbajun]|uniref:Uncharacterized protein n=1 Tax=Thelephora ganbajun TaxID=370292 RepID=A0ACB6Z0J2_THEGA|nr:hypothetical protein BDM02DRAFT_3192239 [Thelephora ganbajun]